MSIPELKLRDHARELSRRDFVRIVSGAAIGGFCLSGCGVPRSVQSADAPIISEINGSASAGAAAVRMNPPFNPWEPGETIYDVPEATGMVLFRGDDGPWLNTSLETDEVFTSFGLRGKAAFAWVAGNLRNNRDAGLELYHAGYDIINHSLTHSHYDDKNNALEMAPADELFGEILGYVPETYAAPGLAEGPRITAELIRLGKCATSTRVFIGDTDQPALTRDEIVAHAVAQIKSGSIIVFHPETASHGATRQALPYILQYILDSGLRPVNLPEFLSQRYTSGGVRKDSSPVIRKEVFRGTLGGQTDVMAAACCGGVLL